MKISLAIPFYNASEYFENCVKQSLESDFISEIIVSDDKSENRHLDVIKSFAEKYPKIKVYENETNLGAYKNKYLTVSRCSNDWVFLLDSDNYLEENVLDILKQVEYQEGICYTPKTQIIPGRVLTHNFPDKIIDKKISSQYLKNNEHFFDYFLNTGNFIVNKKNYIDSQKEFYLSNENVFAADVIAFSYYWLAYGYSFSFIDGFCYNHLTRPDSYWVSYAYKSNNIAEKYKNLIANL